MRTILILAAVPPLLALAACGNRNFEKADGTFDRDGYRSLMGGSCALGLAVGDSGLPSEQRNQVCNCVMDRMLDENSDDQLRATVRDRELGQRTQQAAIQVCLERLDLVAPGQQVFAPRTDGPPPEEPPPAFGGTAKPEPLVMPPGFDGNRRAADEAESALENANRDVEEALRAIEGR